MSAFIKAVFTRVGVLDLKEPLEVEDLNQVLADSMKTGTILMLGPYAVKADAVIGFAMVDAAVEEKAGELYL